MIGLTRPVGDRRSRGDVPLLFLKYNAENPLRFLILFPRPPVDERYGERPCLQQAQAEMLNPAGADTPGCTCGVLNSLATTKTAASSPCSTIFQLQPVVGLEGSVTITSS